ncbi:MAG: DNA alkylation repair protein [Anaerolineales bacterium]
MTAINPKKLEPQIRRLLDYFDQPAQFVYELRFLCEYYSDRAYRAGEESTLPSLIKSYHIPRPLLHEIEKYISPLCQSQPEQALDISKALWQPDILEFKLIAIFVIKSIPTNYAQTEFQILENWVMGCKNINLLQHLNNALIEQFLLPEPLILMGQIQNWLKSDNRALKRFGYQLLKSSIDQFPFDYLPLIYKIIHSSIYETSSSFRNDINAIFIELTKRSPKEISYLLRSAYQEKPHPNIMRIFRETLKYYPTDQQAELEKFIHQS